MIKLADADKTKRDAAEAAFIVATSQPLWRSFRDLLQATPVSLENLPGKLRS